MVSSDQYPQFVQPMSSPKDGPRQFHGESRSQLRSEVETLTVAFASRYLALMAAGVETEVSRFEKAAGDLALARYHILLGNLRDARSYVTSATAAL